MGQTCGDLDLRTEETENDVPIHKCKKRLMVIKPVVRDQNW